MMKPVFLILPALAVCASAAAFDNSEWKLVFEDTFERKEVGPDWAIRGKSEIVDGKLKYGVDGNHTAVIDRPFAPDVRVEFDAVPAPEKPACDLSVGLGCGDKAGGYGCAYLLGFGGNYGKMNQIQGGRDMKWVSDWKPKVTIQPGKVHHVVGTKEGTTLTLEVDGQVVMTTTDKSPLGGPGFDRAGLITWNGMIADNVKVYERKVPHPDTPHYVYGLKGLPFGLDDDRKLSTIKPSSDPAVSKAVELFNVGKPREAEAAFLSLSDPEMQAAGATFAVGHLYYEATREELQRTGQRLIDLSTAHPKDERLLDYAELGRNIAMLTVLRFSGGPSGEYAAGAILAMGRDNNPFYDKADFYKMRLMRAHYMEGGQPNAPVVLAKFNELKQWYPLNQSLRELTGEEIPWGEHLVDDTSGAPAWARYLRELYARQCTVLNWWFTKRQAPDGQLGGGWGDDCEILRDWGPLASISTGDPAIVAGIERLSLGIWGTSINAEYGFGGYSDCEHSSEPSSDTQPTMMILKWGDPLFIERNMRSAKSIRDIYMGVDETGHYRFRSGHYGDGMVGDKPEQEGDVHYNARTMKHLQHLAFWGNAEAKRVYLSWLEGWLKQTMAEYPNKPAGAVPGQLFFPSGTPVVPSGTTEKDWVSSNAPAPGSPPGMDGMIHGGFLANHYFTNDPAYLEPMHNYLKWTSFGPLVRSRTGLPIGSREWFLHAQQGETHTDTVAAFRKRTSDKTIDEYLMRFATNYQRYMVNNDLDALMKSIETTCRKMRLNFRIMTEELLQTDRAGLPATRESLGAYTGALHIWRDSLLPDMAVTWEAPDTDFAALVVANSRERIRVWLYSFHDEPIQLGMRLWQLTPGVYEAMDGEIMPGETTNLRYGWQEREPFTFRRRLDTHVVTVPPRKAYAVDLRLIKPLDVSPTAPDLGIADRDVVMSDSGTIQATIHSLGSEPAGETLVALEMKDDSGKWTRVAEHRAAAMPAPGLDPVTQTLVFEKVAPAKAFRVVVDPKGEFDELYKGNNVAHLKM